MSGDPGKPLRDVSRRLSVTEGRLASVTERVTRLEAQRSLSDQLLSTLMLDELQRCEAAFDRLLLRPTSDGPLIEARLAGLRNVLRFAEQAKSS